MENNLDTQIETLKTQVSEEKQKFSTTKIDMSFWELSSMHQEEELIIRPEYQRFFRWTAHQKTALIESILLGIPIPPIFVAELENGKWELIDGLQRISTVISFFGKLKNNNNISLNDIENIEENDEEGKISSENDWRLLAGELVTSLEGLSFKDFPTAYQINLKRAGCRVEILRRSEKNTDIQDMKYELFKRLNSGGSKLTAQEIRNAIYRGINDKINVLIEKLSDYPAFVNIVTNSLSAKQKRELYDQELVLRFMTFFDINNRVGTAEKCLDTFMKTAVNDKDFNSDKYENLFKQVFDILDNHTVKDIVNGFRGGNRVFSPTIFDGITVALAYNISKYKNNNTLVEQAITKLKNDEAFQKNRKKDSGYTYRIKNRIEAAIRIFESV